MQMCSTWFSAKTELVLNCLKADLSRHELLQQRKRADGSPWGLLCRNHCRWNPWELCFECMEVSTCGLLVSWFWHIRLVDPIDIHLCVFVFPIQRVHISGNFPNVSQVRCSDLATVGLRSCLQNYFFLCVQARDWVTPAMKRMLPWFVEILAFPSAFAMDSTGCWANHIDPTVLQWPQAVSFCVLGQPATVVPKVKGQHHRFLTVICLWLNSPVSKMAVITVCFCRGDWKTKVLLSLRTAQW